MSIAPFEMKCFTAWNCCPGQEVRLGQIVHTPSSGLTVGVPHDGHLAGGFARRPRFFAFCALAVGDTTCGITSPARITITSSPSRTSLRSQVLLVVEGGELHGDARDLHGLELRRTGPGGRCGPRSTRSS